MWTSSEIDEVLGKDPGISGLVKPMTAAKIVKLRYGIKDDGNVDASSDIQGELNGKACDAISITFWIPNSILECSLSRYQYRLYHENQ